MEGRQEIQTELCSECAFEMDVSKLGLHTNVVCPNCDREVWVKCELDQYLLTDSYAVGGMSMVFAAQDTTLHREVAIKVLNETYSSDAVRMQEFQKEAQITAALSHPHIVRVFSVGMAQGVYYIAMEMVPGENLEERMRREGAIKEADILPIAAEIIAGLSAAKQAGLIHRDVKPGNILFDAAGKVKIVDFGLALVTQGGSAKAEEIWATPYYVPPEALDGLEEDFRSDMYALGATLYHALSGQPSIPDDSKSVSAVREAKQGIVPLAEVAPDLHPEVCRFVDKAMALQPTKRFSSYEDMAKACDRVQRLLDGEEVGAEIDDEGGVRQKRRSFKKRLLALAVFGGVGLPLVGLAAYLFVIKPKNNQSGDADLVELSNNVVDEANDESLDDGQSIDPAVAAKIGEMFRQSHKLLEEGKYDDAKLLFDQLLNDDQLKEPAASWAGVEAVISAWMNGDSNGAMVAIRNLEHHIGGGDIVESSELKSLVAKLLKPGEITEPELVSGSGDVVSLMAIALKNWEIGAWELAVPIWSKIDTMNIPSRSPLHVYKLLSKRYLADYDLLKPFIDLQEPVTSTEARDRANQLDEALVKLKTKGRAKFNVRAWQVRTMLQLRELRNQEEAKLTE